MKSAQVYANRYTLLRDELKEIDQDLEVAFVPRSLYELAFLEKCVKEDVKEKGFCPFSHGRGVDGSLAVEEKFERKKCWHVALSGYYDYEGTIYIISGQTTNAFGTLPPLNQISSQNTVTPVATPISLQYRLPQNLQGSRKAWVIQSLWRLSVL